MSLHDKARDGTLNRVTLRDQPPGYDIDAPDQAKGYSPLAYAVENGHMSSIRVLVNNGASVTRRTSGPDRRTILHIAAASNSASAVEVVNYLISRNISVDDQAGIHPNDTPLMTALRHGAPPEVIKALKDAGASLTIKNSNGETAQDIADQLANPAPKEELLPEAEKGKGTPELTNFIAAAFRLALVSLGPWKGVKSSLTDAIKQVGREVTPKPGRTEQRPPDWKPKTEQDFQDVIKDLITELGLEDIFPPGSELIDDIAAKAAEVMKDPEHADKTPEEIKDLCRCALFQPILYCDDSGSMKGARMVAQTEIVDEISRIMNLFVPEDKGVHLRFINRNDTGLDNLTGEALRGKMNFVPDGGTPLGTSLRNKVLQPYVYDPIDKKQIFERPILVITITDGVPNQEDLDKFEKEIVECSKKVDRGGYAYDTVKFLVSQVGTDQEAKKFLDGLDAAAQTTSLQGLLHRTSDQLDAKYTELRNNRRLLDIWLLRTLLPPTVTGKP